MFFVDGNKKKTAVFLLAVFFVLMDRFLKSLAVNGFFDSPINVIGDFFKLGFTANRGLAFSIPIGGLFLSAITALAILILILFFARLAKRGFFSEAAAIFLVILGGASNLIDRFKFGYVVDYFDLKYFTVFNLADVMIVGGVLWLGWRTLGVDESKNL